MSHPSQMVAPNHLLEQDSLFRRRILVMAAGTVVLSGALISAFNYIFFERGAIEHVAQFELTAATLFPYLISAVMAAIVAIGILTVLPYRKFNRPLRTIASRLTSLADGDLTTRVQLQADNTELQHMVDDLNSSVDTLNTLISHWKLINRRQWELLEGAKQAAAAADSEQALRLINQMETNWEQIATIEEQLITG